MSRRTLVTPVADTDWKIRRAFKVGEAAYLLGLSYDVTLAEIHAGNLGARKVGKYHLVPTEEIHRYMAPAIQPVAGKPGRRSA